MVTSAHLICLCESLGGWPLFMGAWIVTSNGDLTASVPSWVQTQTGGCWRLESLQCGSPGDHGTWVGVRKGEGTVMTGCVSCHPVLCAQSWAPWVEKEEGWMG